MSPSPLLPLLLLALSSSPMALSRGPPAGPWAPIKNLTDPHVVEIAKFALMVHDVETRTGLNFIKVVSGETQVESGTNYRLVIEAKDSVDGNIGSYRAVVKEWRDDKILMSFEKISN